MNNASVNGIPIRINHGRGIVVSGNAFLHCRYGVYLDTSSTHCQVFEQDYSGVTTTNVHDGGTLNTVFDGLTAKNVYAVRSIYQDITPANTQQPSMQIQHGHAKILNGQTHIDVTFAENFGNSTRITVIAVSGLLSESVICAATGAGTMTITRTGNTGDNTCFWVAFGELAGAP